MGVFAATMVLAGSETFAGTYSGITDFGDNPANLRMYLYNPYKSVEEAVRQSPPLVVVLHGYTQDARETTKQAGWIRLAGHWKFLVLMPEQPRRSNNPFGCLEWWKIEVEAKWLEGATFSIREAIFKVVAKYRAKLDRIYIVGVSAGASPGREDGKHERGTNTQFASLEPIAVSCTIT
jgi:poly(3-hydroxybutyrate) depolymerase